MTKFEVGKKYRNKSFSEVIFEVVAIGPNYLLYTSGDYTNPTIWHMYKSGEEEYEEVVEPKTGTLWLNVQGPDSNWENGLYYTRKDADKYAMPGRIACIEVPWTEGQGL